MNDNKVHNLGKRRSFIFLGIPAVLAAALISVSASGSATPGDPMTNQPGDEESMSNDDPFCVDAAHQDLAIPSGAIVAFYALRCPAGWVNADGQNGTPDLRGQFVRGASANRMVGTYQDDAVGSHQHSYTDWSNHCNSRDNGRDRSNGFCRSSGAFTANKSTGTTGESETRPKNIALLYCMKQ